MKLRHDQWCDLDEEGRCDCGIDEINASFSRKDELLREAVECLNDAVDAIDEGDDEDGEFDFERDLITRIRKEVDGERS